MIYFRKYRIVTDESTYDYTNAPSSALGQMQVFLSLGISGIIFEINFEIFLIFSFTTIIIFSEETGSLDQTS